MPRKTILLISLSQLANYAIPLLTFPILVRAFQISQYGVWVEVSTLTSLAISFGISGLANTLGLMIANHTTDDRIVYANTLYLALVVGIGLSVLVFALAPGLNMLTMRSVIGVDLLRAASPIPLLFALQAMISQVFRLQNRPVSGALLEITLVVVRVLTAFYALASRDLFSFAVIYVLSQAFVILAFSVVAYRGLPFLMPSYPIIKRMLGHSVQLTFVSQANWFVMYADRLLLSLLSASTAVAIYAASYQLAMPLVALGWPYLYAILPILGNQWKNGDIQGMQSSIRHSARSMSLLIIPAVIGLFLVGDHLLRVLATEDFAQGNILIGMIALGMGIDVIGGNLQYIFYAQGRPEILRNIYLRAAVLNVLANFIAIPLLSYLGAGLTTLLTFIYIFVSLWWRTEMPFRVLFDLDTAARCLVASLGMGAWVLLTVAPTIPRLALAIIGGAILYGIGLLLLRVMTWDEFMALPRALRQRLSR
jgi:O-antigen/teichoic acid export membrane protein